jgi:hypothetical protein
MGFVYKRANQVRVVMATRSTSHISALVQLKLDAFGHMQPEFEASFQFVQDMHGQKRFTAFSASDVVRYLHALWICDCKGRLLSVSKTVKEYEGKQCLELLRLWQQGDTASIVDFLQHKLDMLPVSQITQQHTEAYHLQQDDGLAQRLAHGRLIMLNRGFNLMYALDALFALSEAALLEEVRVACGQYGHLPKQIAQQLEEMDAPLYAYVPNQALAQRNMLIMNELGINVAFRPSDLPGQRSWRVLPATEPLGPYAEHVVEGYQELTAPFHNNIQGERFVDRPERDDTTPSAPDL